MKTRSLRRLAWSFAFALMLGPAALLAQTTEAAPAESAAHKKTLFETIKEGGWVMIPITAISIATLYLIGDGVTRTSRKRAIPAEQETAVKDYFRRGDYVGAYEYCKANPSPFTNVVRVGVSLLGDGKTMVEEGMLAELSKENSRMQVWISYLSVIGVCAPMVGLLGTVTGMISAFATLGTSGIGDPSKLAAAIGEVLVATASGLFVAIPAFGAFYFFRNRAAIILHDIEDVVSRLFRKMNYAAMADVLIGDEELFAADPSWLTEQPAGTGEATA
jgi:biopolymer transport protein ExbB